LFLKEKIGLLQGLLNLIGCPLAGLEIKIPEWTFTDEGLYPLIKKGRRRKYFST